MGALSVLPTSYSALTSFETCPKKHYLTRITKEVDDPMGESALWGLRVHEALELYLRDGKPLPTGVRQYQKYADLLAERAKGGKLLLEQQLAVDRAFQPTGWWDDDAWFRGIVDVAIIHGEKAFIFDWKTGKKKSDHDQLQLFAALLASHYPNIETISTAYVWLQAQEITSKTFTRDEAMLVWAPLTARIANLENALDTESWPAKPNGLCKRWCPVGAAKCEHCGIRST